MTKRIRTIVVAVAAAAMLAPAAQAGGLEPNGMDWSALRAPQGMDWSSLRAPQGMDWSALGAPRAKRHGAGF